MINTLKKLFNKKQKEDSFVERSLEALEVLKLDTRVKPMRDPSVQIKVEDLTCINHRLNCLNSDIRDISSKLSRLETSIDKILNQSV